MKEIKVEDILEATRQGLLKWQRKEERWGPRFEAEFQGWKLILNYRITHTNYSTDDSPRRPWLRHDDYGLTEQNEELRKAGVTWERHYTEIWDAFNEVKTTYSTSWHRQGQYVVSKMEVSEVADYKALEELHGLVSLIS